VKLKIIVVMLCGVAGAGASFAFAAGGSHGPNAHCQHAVVFGTASAPQTLTVTVARSPFRWRSLPSGKTVNVSIGSTGQTLRFSGEGCLGSDGTLTVRSAVLHAVTPHTGNGGGGNGDDGQTTTTTTTTATTTTATTTDGGATTTSGG
jgi:hypothetical protein